MERLYGFNKFGFCKDLPTGRGPRKGVYFFELFASDPKVANFLLKLFRPFVYDTVRDYINLMRAHIEINLT